MIWYRMEKNTSQDLAVTDYQGKRQVRRVVAVSGDTVDITEEGLLINGSPQQEPEIFQDTNRYEEGSTSR